MSRKAYFVMGPESSGTRMLSQALLLSTQGFGDWTHEQRIGDFNTLIFPSPLPEIIVLRRSLPHGKVWVDLEYIKNQLSESYKIIPLFIIRNYEITALSQIANKHVQTKDQAYRNIKKAIIMAHLDLLPRIINYEHLMLEYTRKQFFNSLGLKVPADMEFIDGNKKYKHNFI